MTETANEQSESYATVRYEFYQSDTHITIVLWLSGVQESELKVNVTCDHFLSIIEKPDSSKYRVEFDFAYAVVDNPVTKISAKKVEIKVPKRDCISWTRLEKVEGAAALPQAAVAARTTNMEPNSGANQATKVGSLSYPSSSRKAADWSAFERQVKADEAEEKPQDEAALNALFQKIYADADDDTKRAMMKSFVESNGTVLSTDWSKVGEKPVKTKPPSGMEFHQWQQ